jgi:hypothetical protein
MDKRDMKGITGIIQIIEVATWPEKALDFQYAFLFNSL